MENPTNEENFDYFNTDVYLLTLHILLEGFYRGQGVFTLDQFLKGSYWKIEEISDEIRDTNDFGSVEDMVLHQVFSIVEGLNLSRVTPGAYELICLPLRIVASDGAPARAVLRPLPP